MDRYFTVATSADATFNEYMTVVNEGDAEHVGVMASLNLEEKKIVLTLAESARSHARVTGSREGTWVHPLFGLTFHVTWKRVGV